MGFDTDQAGRPKGESRLRFGWLATCLLAVFAGTSAQAGTGRTPTLRTVHSGTTTLSGSTSVRNVSISLNREDASFLVFSYRINDSDPQDALVTGQIKGTTGVQFQRSAAGTSAAVIRWYIAEFYNGVWVQRGSSTATTATRTVSLTAVNTAEAFPLMSYRTTGTTFGNDDFIRGTFASSSRLVFESDAGNTGGSTVEWQVVMMENSSVTSGSVSFAAGDDLKTVSSPTMDPTRQWLIYSYSWAGGTTNISQAMVRGWLRSSTALEFERDTSGSAIDLSYYLVQMPSGRATVQQNNMDVDDLTAFELSRTNTLSPSVNLSKTIAMAGYTGQVGRTTYSADDLPGTAWFTVDLQNTTTIECKREVSGDHNSDCAWQTIEFSTNGTEVELEGFSARRRGRGVTLTWQTLHEIDNLGFHVYREKNGEKVRINANLIGGSVLLSGQGGPTLGRSYSFFDKQPAPDGTRYWLEDVDINGKSTWHGPITPQRGDADDTTVSQAALTAEELRPAVESTTQPKGWSADHRASPAFKGKPWDLAGKPALKLGVQRDGWYRVTGAALASAGFDTGGDPARLALFVDGRERAIAVRGGEDGRLDPTDTVEFYGTGADTVWTDTRIHWLAWQPTRGRRIAVEPLPAGAAAASYPAVTELRERSIYFAALKNGDAPNFFGATVTSSGVSRTVHLSELASPDDQVLEVAVQGVTLEPHSISVRVNQQLVGEIGFNGRENTNRRLALPPGTLREGDNVITLRTERKSSDVALLDWLRVEHRRRFVATDGALPFSAPTGGLVTLEGLGAGARVLDVTDPDQVIERPVSIGDAGVTTALPAGDLRRHLAVDERGTLQVSSLTLNTPSHWTAPDNEGDLILLGPRALLAEMKPLQEARRRQGWTPVAVALEDVYDEISYGEPGPAPIRTFLQQAYRTWRLPPKAVILVGDASFDPRGWLGRGRQDLVPTETVAITLLETASDDTLADFDRDGVADLALGRLPVRTVDEAARLARRLASFDPAQAGRNILLVADEDEHDEFEKSAAATRATIPDRFTAVDIFRKKLGSEGAAAELRKRLAEGPLLVDYHGHGSAEIWAGRVLDPDKAAALPALPQPPLVLALTCLNGFFHDVYTHSLGERLLLGENGAALGVIASTGLTGGFELGPFGRDIVRALLVKGLTVGEALREAKLASADHDLRASFVLLGDPTIRLIPQPARPRPDRRAGGFFGCGGPREVPEGTDPGLVPLGALALGLWVRRRRR